MNFYRQYAGFTLAEVLIVMGAIGIIAAISLPILLKNTQDKEFHSAWQKTFSELSQATKLIVEENGGNLVDICTDTYIGQCARDWFADHLSVQKKCRTSTSEGCWHQAGDISLLNNGDDGGWWSIEAPGLILNNGVLIRFVNYSSSCIRNMGSASSPHYVCTLVNIDVNGFKKPNVVGKDIYEVELTNNGILPVGGIYDTWQYSNPTFYGCYSTASGEGCSAYYLYN